MEDSDTTSVKLDQLCVLVSEFDPVLLWGLVRSKVLQHFSLWDLAVDQAVIQAQSEHLGHVPQHKLSLLANSIRSCLKQLQETLEQCCDTDTNFDILPLDWPKMVIKEPKHHLSCKHSEWLLSCDPDMRSIMGNLAEEVNALDHDSSKKQVVARKSEEDTTRGAKMYRQVNSSGPFTCQGCKRVFGVLRSWYRHRAGNRCKGVKYNERKYVRKGKEFLCMYPGCAPIDGTENPAQKAFRHLRPLERHIQLEHLPDQDLVFKCHKCPLKFGFSGMLKSHALEQHDKPFVCNYCGKRFGRKGQMESHELFHTGQRPYVCELCPFRATRMGCMREHQKLKHCGQIEKKHVCEVCGKDFSKLTYLTAHKNTHTGVKTHTCHSCGLQLRNASCHRSHVMSVHKQIVPCGVCGKKFSTLRGCNIHRRDCHGMTI